MPARSQTTNSKDGAPKQPFGYGWNRNLNRLLVVVLIGLSHPLFSQQILWEKKFGWLRNDEITDGFAISDNSVIAIGRSRNYGTSIGSASHLGLIAIKINIATGDTSWIKSLNQLCYPPRCVMGDNNLVYVVAPESTSPNRLRLSLVDTNGILFYRKTLDSIGESPSIEKLIRTNDGNFLVTGSRRGLTTNLTVDMFVIKFDGLGNVLWNNRYNENPNSGGNHIEETPEGHYILSGNAGARIWRVELDSDGNQVSSNFLHQTPSFVNFNESATIYSTPDSSNIISGTMAGSNERYYFGSHKQQGNIKSWGGEQNGIMYKPYINADGSIIQYTAVLGNFTLKRLHPDSSTLWSANLSNRIGSSSTNLTKLVYLSDSSAIAVGFLFYLTSQANDFYFCRISNVGVPYDPSILVSNLPELKAEKLVPYPNPVESSLVFKGLKEEGILLFYDPKGQVLQEMPIKPYQRIHLSQLPKGLYLYRIQTKTNSYSGKLVKN